MSLFVVGPESMVLAFGLSGRPGRSVTTRAEVLAVLDEIERRGEVRLVVIEQRTAERARERVDRMKLDPAAPLVVEVPSLDGPIEGWRTPFDLVRQALGIRI